MKGRFALVIAFLLAVIAVIIVRIYLRNVEKTYEEKMKLVEVLCPNKSVKAGEEIALEDITTTKIPQSVFNEDYFTDDQKNQLKGLKSPVTIAKEIPFKRSMFAREGIGSQTVQDDLFRAITIGVDKVSGVGNLIREGDEVDIYCTFNAAATEGAPGGMQNMKTMAVLTNVFILKTDRETGTRGKSGRLGYGGKSGPSPGSETYSVVTVKVKPEEVSVLTYAQKKGEITLVLRKKGSLDNKTAASVDINNFESSVTKILNERKK